MSDVDPAQLTLRLPDVPSSPELPEVQWFFRRIFTYALVGILCVLKGVVIALLALHQQSAETAKSLEHLGQTSDALIALLILFYLGGATLTDIVRLVATWRIHGSNGGTP